MTKQHKDTQFKCEKCGGLYSSQGIKTHIKHCSGSETLTSPSVSQISGGSPAPHEGAGQGIENKTSNVQQVNFMAEANSKKEDISPKKEDEYGCPCGALFGKKYKHCPECGESLTWS